MIGTYFKADGCDGFARKRAFVRLTEARAKSGSGVYKAEPLEAQNAGDLRKNFFAAAWERGGSPAARGRSKR